MKIKDTLESVKNDLQGYFTIANISFLLLIVFTVGILMTETHRAVVTIGWVGLVVMSLFGVNKANIARLKQFKIVLLLTGIFFIQLVYGAFTDFDYNADYLKGRLMIKIPFLILPVILFFLPKLSLKKLQFVLLAFMLGVLFIAIQGSIHYLGHREEVHRLYLMSKTLPLPLNHVRYSLMLSLSIVIGGYLIYKKVWFLYSFEKYIIMGITGFLFVFLHLLSVRIGLLTFYAIAFVLALLISLKMKKKTIVLYVLGAMLLIPAVSYVAVKPFKNIVTNTLNDLKYTKYQYLANTHSLTARAFSYRVAGKLIKENPVFGVGIGDLEEQVNRTYIKEYPEIKIRLKPHNQFLNYTVAFGFVGIIIFCLCFYGLLWNKNLRNSLLVIVPFLLLTISFLFESTLETQLGANFSLCFLFIPLWFIISNSENKEEMKEEFLPFK